MVIPSNNSSLARFHDSSNVDPFGRNIGSNSNSSAHPWFGASTTFGPPMAASAFAGNKSFPLGSTSSHFAGSTFSIQNQGNALQQSNSHFGPSTASAPSSYFSFGSVSSSPAFGTPTAALISDSSVKKPFGSTVFGVLPSFGSDGSIGDSGFDRAPRNSASGALTTTIFSIPNNSGIGFESAPKLLHSNSAHGSTSPIFGVSDKPPFAPGNSSSGLSRSISGFPSTSAFQVATTPGFDINSRPSFWSASASAGGSLSGPKRSPPITIGAPRTSNLLDSITSRFNLSSTSAPRNSSIFGIQSSSGSHDARMLESTVRTQHRGSGVASYSATKEVHDANSRYSVGKIQSISAMPVYKDKSHEELRLEDYVLCKKGDQSSGSAFFKTFDTPANIFRYTPIPNFSSVGSPFHPFKSNSAAPKSQSFIMSNNTISMASTLSPFVNPFSPTNLYPSQSQAIISQPNIFSSLPTFTRDLNPSSTTPFSESMSTNSFQSPIITSTSTIASVSTLSSIGPSFLASSSVQSTSVTALAPGVSILNASQPGKPAEKVDSLSTNNHSQPSCGSNGLTMVTEVGSQNINEQQYVSSSTVGMQTSLVANPFVTPSANDRLSAVTSIQYGISSLPVSNKLSPDKSSSFLRIRHVSLRHNRLLPAQRHNRGSSEPKVPFFSDKEDRRGPIAPLLPRENPRAWVMNSLSGQEHTPLHSYADSKICKDKSSPYSSFQHNVSPTVVTTDASIQEEDLSAIPNSHQDAAAAATKKHEPDVLSLMPKLPDVDYYTKPPIKELEAKETAKPGCCSRVNNFVIGRQGYGSIKFLGETDVRCLDLKSIVQFNDREVIVYPDDRLKPPDGRSLNKPAEVTLLNIKCISKKTGKQYVDGPLVQRYKDVLIKKAQEQGSEFVSYDPVLGEWKFRVKHF